MATHRRQTRTTEWELARLTLLRELLAGELAFSDPLRRLRLTNAARHRPLAACLDLAIPAPPDQRRGVTAPSHPARAPPADAFPARLRPPRDGAIRRSRGGFLVWVP